MTTVIELERGEEPRKNERYALVFVSSKPPKEGAAIAIRDDGQTFFAFEYDAHIVLAVVGEKGLAVIANGNSRALFWRF